MSIELDIAKKCGCVKKSGIEFPKTFETKEEALKEANELTKEFNETFCKKHEFAVEDDGDKLIIKVIDA